TFLGGEIGKVDGEAVTPYFSLLVGLVVENQAIFLTADRKSIANFFADGIQLLTKMFFLLQVLTEIIDIYKEAEDKAARHTARIDDGFACLLARLSVESQPLQRNGKLSQRNRNAFYIL